MTYAKCAPLAVFLFATFLMFPAKKVEAIDCLGVCSPLQGLTCGPSSTGCFCFPFSLFIGLCTPTIPPPYVAKMIDAHPNLCQSNDQCIKKGSGNLCARFPDPEIKQGWCINSDVGELHKDGILRMPMTITDDPRTGLASASVSKMIDAHPNLCQSNDECINKGSGNYCARYPNSDTLYGWCINSDAGELLKGFLKMPAAIGQECYDASTLNKVL